eukprot:UN4710
MPTDFDRIAAGAPGLCGAGKFPPPSARLNARNSSRGGRAKRRLLPIKTQASAHVEEPAGGEVPHRYRPLLPALGRPTAALCDSLVPEISDVPEPPDLVKGRRAVAPVVVAPDPKMFELRRVASLQGLGNCLRTVVSNSVNDELELLEIRGVLQSRGDNFSSIIVQALVHELEIRALGVVAGLELAGNVIRDPAVLPGLVYKLVHVV